MVNNKEYKRRYYQKNKQYFKEHNKRYKLENKERLSKEFKEWRKKNEDKHNKLTKDWRKNNPDKVAKWDKKYAQNNPIKIKARNYAKQYNFRQQFCLMCLLLDRQTKAINFHHTDYEHNLGFSVCYKHHNIVDKWGGLN